MALRLPWRRRSEGFEWHKYVRTTIAHRREARREKAAVIGRSAVAGASDAAKAGGGLLVRAVAQVRAWIGGGAAWLVQTAGWLLARLFRGARAVAAPLTEPISTFAHAVLDILARRGVRGPLMLAGAVAGLATTVRSARVGRLDYEAKLAAAVAAACLIGALLPWLWANPSARKFSSQLALTARRIPHRGAVGLALLALAVAGTGTYVWSSRGGVTLPTLSLSSLVPFNAKGSPIRGVAQALGGDGLRIEATTVKLDGIEVPERSQTCRRSGGRSWRCGESAAAALARLVDGRPIQCTATGAAHGGRVTARCMRGKVDVAARMVSEGYAFAETGMFASYSKEQQEARAAKRGLWSGPQEPERAEDYRKRLWREAAAKAPGGCPIKGSVQRRAKIYHLPWASGYDGIRVRTSRGGRWLCNEEEARAAGFRAAELAR